MAPLRECQAARRYTASRKCRIWITGAKGRSASGGSGSFNTARNTRAAKAANAGEPRARGRASSTRSSNTTAPSSMTRMRSASATAS
ncbi:hypothetical protein G6F65_023133 [Rhizopus arrhizus]|nr:hypothetical protein G6F32_017422 [Rhizopus arrhizus]KAG1242214.1 hypothetical protein G6F65_023133 [Rhizopus arrhizus]